MLHEEVSSIAIVTRQCCKHVVLCACCLRDDDGIHASSEQKVPALGLWVGGFRCEIHSIESVLYCRRRLVKRIYIPMPDADTRRALLKHLLSGQPARLSRADFEHLVAATTNYSGSDLAALCREAAIIPIRCAPAILSKQGVRTTVNIVACDLLGLGVLSDEAAFR